MSAVGINNATFGAGDDTGPAELLDGDKGFVDVGVLGNKVCCEVESETGGGKDMWRYFCDVCG